MDKRSFYKNQKLFKMEDIDINKTFVSKKTSYGKESFKYYIGYNDDDVIESLCIKLPQMIGYVKPFKKKIIIIIIIKTLRECFFRVSDKKLSKNYNKIWERVSNLIKIKSDSEPFYGNNDKYTWARVNTYRNKINTKFQGKKIPKEFFIDNVRICY